MQYSKASDNSVALQAEGNIKMTINKGMSSIEVITLVNTLIGSKLPEITESVTKKIEENTKKFGTLLHSKITNNEYDYNPEKLSEPDVLFTLASASQKAALKGDKIDMDTLASLIEKRLQENNDDLDFYIETAADSVTQISQKLINTLAAIYVLKSPLMVTTLEKQIELAPNLAKYINEKVFCSEEVIKKSEMMVLIAKGLIFDNQKQLGIPEWGDRFDNYEPFDKIVDKLKLNKDDAQLTDVKKMYENFSNSGLSRYYLTIPGQLIAMILIKPVARFHDINEFLI